ncbi:MAG: D-alanine--poly(phosphoribitol) ligase subunit DltC [Limosilactobacillus sp.]|uniref:D-alanine--poly(phosphoribitol) ligase subunit DltC n=1 Tax=Limosilactobacillus sp. TaxID=2773925 RepID=UPI002711A872|nr:D-alanine--poly(phosphoribitol) ligase subunit DltC [Limosilactobacillus sp.]
MQEQIIDLLSQATGRDAEDFSDASQNLFDSGLLDSMATVGLLLSLQDTFDIQVPVSEFDREQWNTVEKIEQRVKELQNA